MIVLTCGSCRTYQIRVLYRSPDFIINLDHIRCPVCDVAPSEETVAKLKDLAQRNYELQQEWKAVTDVAKEDGWTLGVLHMEP